MVSSSRRRGASSVSSLYRVLVLVVAVGILLSAAGAEGAQDATKGSHDDLLHFPGRIRSPNRGEPKDPNRTIPLTITNKCDSTIWPGIATQAGRGPGTGGFELAQGKSKDLWVSWDWQGRVWGRTNCTVNGDSCSCKTGDCFGMLDCEASVSALCGNKNRIILTAKRVQRQQHSLNSHWLVVCMGSRLSTISLWLMATISRWASTTYPPRTQHSFRRI